MGGSSTVTIGYKYHIGMHLGLCHGPVDAVTEIRVADINVWSGNVTSNQTINIDEPDAFGGDEREGGIQGGIDIAMGGAAQTKNNYLLSKIGDVPAFRGILSAILKSPYLGSVPRFKPWAFTVKRSSPAWTGGGAALIGNDSNPANIIYELLTSRDFGLGYSESRINLPSFTAAATTLSGESFGLSFLWSQDQTIEEFISEVLRHIDAALYVDPTDGKWRLKLVRDDYVVGSLPVLNESNVTEVSEFSRPSWGELTNQMSVIYTDGEGSAPTWANSSVMVHNLAAVQTQGSQIISQSRRYPGITKASLANKVCARDLAQTSRPLARVKMIGSASLSTLRPGDAFKFSWEEYGVVQMVCRVVEIDYGTVEDGKITLTAIEDAFSLGQSLYAAPPPTDWVDPRSDPAAAAFRRVDEATYYHMARLFNDSDTLLGDVDDDGGFLITQAVRPSGDTFGYSVWVDSGSGYAKDGGAGEFCPTATLDGAIGPNDLEVNVENGVDLDLVEIGTWAYMGTEIVKVTAIDLINDTVTFDRGMIDTTPRAQADGTRIYFASTLESISRTQYLSSQNINVKLLTRTSRGELTLAAAPVNVLDFNARFIRPYPPGNVRLNGEAYPTAITGEPVLTWAHRDRTLQTAGLTLQSAGNIGPEVGTTYTIRVYSNGGTLERTVTGITGTTYTYTLAFEAADGGPFDSITMQLEAVRDGRVSWQYQEVSAKLCGYGRQYGNDYGGLP